MGGKYQSGLQKKAWKVSGASRTMQIQQMVDSMLSDRSWLLEFCREMFMQNSESTSYDTRKKRGRLLERFQNQLKKHQDGYGLKDHNRD